MNMKQMIAIAISICAVAGAFMVVGTDDTDAKSAGAMSVYIYDGSEWHDYPNMSGYNALQALQATGLSISADTDYVLEKYNSYGEYLEINDNYGKVTSINGLAEYESDVWNVFVYDGTNWVAGIDAIGFITPFTDGAAPSANIALCYGPASDVAPSSIYNNTPNKCDLITPSGEDYEYTFTLIIDNDYTPTISPGTQVLTSTGTETLTAEMLHDGITVIGYGSNAYAALKDAVGENNINGTDTPGAYNGWLDSLFGLTTTMSGTNYVYWTQYIDGPGIPLYTSFNLGAYSTLDNVPSDIDSTNEVFVQSAFILEYVLYVYNN